MNELFVDFAKAHASRHGYLLAQTLSPVAPANDPQRLQAIFRSTNSHSVKGDIKHFIKTNMPRKGSDQEELNGWVDVFIAYWKAIGEISAGERGQVSAQILAYGSYF